MKGACCVITGSPYLTKYASKYNDYVVEIPTSIDLERYSKINIKNKNKFTIGWIGSPTTSEYILDILPALSRFSSEFICEIVLVGFNKSLEDLLKTLPVKIVPWDEELEIYEINKFSVGIMPLPNDLWSQGKCGFKLIQYMGCQKPTISTPLEANIKINHGNENLFATNNQEWYEALKKVFSNQEYYNNIGIQNQEIVREYYSIEANQNTYIKLFNNNVSSGLV